MTTLKVPGMLHVNFGAPLTALAVIAVAGLVVAMTPRTSSSPIALSATTAPISVLREPTAASGETCSTTVP